MAKKKSPSPRTERRAQERSLEKLAHAREKLAGLEEGGSPERPIEVVSASVVEPTALTMRCLRCDGAPRVLDHAARTIGGVSLRAVTLECAACGARRVVYLRIVSVLPS